MRRCINEKWESCRAEAKVFIDAGDVVVAIVGISVDDLKMPVGKVEEYPEHRILITINILLGFFN